MKATLKPALGLAALFLSAWLPLGASAEPVVVGSVNPASLQVTIFKDLLVDKFQDGTPILDVYGRYEEAEKVFVMIRAGKSADGLCQTDAFRLVRISGNRLAIAADHRTQAPWHGFEAVPTLRRCLSATCSGSCRALGDPDTPQDLTDYYCECTSASGPCEPAFQLLNKHEDISWQGLEGPEEHPCNDPRCRP